MKIKERVREEMRKESAIQEKQILPAVIKGHGMYWTDVEFVNIGIMLNRISSTQALLPSGSEATNRDA